MSFASLKALLRDWPQTPVPAGPFDTKPQERLRRVLAAFQDQNVRPGPADLVTLVRHVLRQEHLKHPGVVPCLELPGPTPPTPWPGADVWQSHGCRMVGIGNQLRIEADDWTPNWLNTLHRQGPENSAYINSPFAPAESEEVRHPRLQHPEQWQVPADPAVRAAFHGFTHYISRSQAETVRSVLLSPLGANLMVVMPTGGGKSLVGLATSFIGHASRGVSLVLVPTVALAFDQVEQARQWRPRDTVDAWHSGLNPEERKAIRQRLREGTQRLLFLAPESVRILKDDLLALAMAGWLHSVVIDEAHLLSQWGGSFRPDMQWMTATLRLLRDSCPSGRPFRTVLMTATLTREVYQDLRTLFPDLIPVASVHLRPEPDYYLCQATAEDDKEAKVLEILRHSPRPAILYTTKVEDAKAWHRKCLQAGWTRTGLLHGESSATDRDKAVRLWRENALDLMVATSAFGLGMDKGDVRLVLHACVPETMDRFYQEIGRGGRDGRASASVMVYTKADYLLAARLGQPAAVTNELGLERWRSMWLEGTEEAEGIHCLNLRTTRPGLTWDSDRNIAWNLRTLLLMVRAGVLEFLDVPTPKITRGAEEADEAWEERLHAAWDLAETTARVRLRGNAPLDEASWNASVGQFRAEAAETAQSRWKQLREVIHPKKRQASDLPRALQRIYEVPEAFVYQVWPNPEVNLVPTALSIERKHGKRLPELLSNRIGSQGTCFITYDPVLMCEELADHMLSLIETLLRFGIQEVALPEDKMNRWFPQQNTNLPFCTVRDLEDEDPLHNPPTTSRVSVLPATVNAVPDSLLLLHRPLHFILLPKDCREPGHPHRRIGDTFTNVIDLNTFFNFTNP
jgi:ATP-dependent DNA helicase RecQ